LASDHEYGEVILGEKAMLDPDLGKLYSVERKILA